MGFMDEARAELLNSGAAGSRCLMCTLIKEWPQPDASELAEVLADPAFSVATVRRVLAGRGVDASEHQVGNHRRRHLEKAGRS